MNEEMMETNLKTMLETVQDQIDGDIEFIDDEGEPLAITRVQTFSEAGLLTMNKGVVVSFDNNTRFQLTIVQA